jgi:hypothetical protein
MRSPHPEIDDAPGLQWRPRANDWVAVWVALPYLVKRGYAPKTARLWPPTDDTAAPLDAATVDMIRGECKRLQAEMLAWANDGDGRKPAYDGTISSLIRRYRADPDSPYHDLRDSSQAQYDDILRWLDVSVGGRIINGLCGPDFKRFYREWMQSDRGDRQISRAYSRIQKLRVVINFGVTMRYEGCAETAAVLGKMKFPQGRARTEYMTADQAVAIRRRAHEIGRPSIALAQAFMFDLGLRPKDVVGEWIRISSPGISAITDGGRKWVVGIDWSEIDADLILTHSLSKSRRGRHALADRKSGNVKTFDLKLYPMVMEEINLRARNINGLAAIGGPERIGPVIINERTGLPYAKRTFPWIWRRIAVAVGVPANLQSRDSRAGAITEGIEATGGDMEANRHAAGHSQIATTQRYSRAADRQTAKVAVFRARKREGDT